MSSSLVGVSAEKQNEINGIVAQIALEQVAWIASNYDDGVLIVIVDAINRFWEYYTALHGSTETRKTYFNNLQELQLRIFS